MEWRLAILPPLNLANDFLERARSFMSNLNQTKVNEMQIKEVLGGLLNKDEMVRSLFTRLAEVV